MAQWSRPEPDGAAPGGDGPFEGRTPAEALARARAALGPSAELRCWKTRRGGVAGFFATEIFVAGVEPPPGAERSLTRAEARKVAKAQSQARPQPRSRPGRTGATPTAPAAPAETAATPPAAAAAPAETAATPPSDVPETGDLPVTAAAAPTPEKPAVTADDDGRTGSDDRDTEGQLADSLAALVDGTSDQLTLNFDTIPSSTFSEVLAEAEAAVSGVAAWSERPGATVRSVVEPAPDLTGPADAAGPETPGTPDGASGPADGPTDPDATPPAPPRRTPPRAVVEPVPPPPADAEDAAASDSTASDSTASDSTASDTPVADGPVADATPPATTGSETGGPPATRPKAKARKAPTKPRTRAAAPPTPADRAPAGPAPVAVPDLHERLRSLGVAADLVSSAADPTIDGVVRSLDRLEPAPPLPTAPGAVVAVVGPDRVVERTVRLLLGEAPYLHGRPVAADRRPWRPESASPMPDPLAGAFQSGDPLEVAGRVARRRKEGLPSVVAVDVVPGQSVDPHVLVVLESVQPDYVLGAVTAAAKRSDVARWCEELGSVRAVALWDSDATVSPAELLGTVPVAFVDGEPATSLGWTLSLVHRAVEDRR